jgi:hypothetical protein
MPCIFFHWRSKSTGQCGRFSRAGRLAAMGMAAALASTPLHAQLDVSVPELPLPGGALGELEREIAGASGETTGRLSELRKRLVRELLHRHPDALERGPRGEAIVRGELTAFSPSAAALDAAGRAGFTILRQRPLGALDARIVVFRAPPGLSTRRALRRLQTLDPGGAYDFNHIYLPVGALPASATEPPQVPDEGTGAEPDRVRIGLVDGGIDLDHPALVDVVIDARGCGDTPVPSTHGTAVASLLAGRSEQYRGAAPGARLHAIDIYCGRPAGGAADALASALADLAAEGLPVINASIVGPANRILEGVVRALVARGHLVVAAVGNDGPSARPLYPAAYEGVVGVTAVNARRRALPEAGRGPHVDFAAPGAGMLAAAVDGHYAEVRGTSFAAPLVAGLLAARLARPDREAAAAAVAALAATAIDLGRTGRDDAYGHGLVGESLRVVP